MKTHMKTQQELLKEMQEAVNSSDSERALRAWLTVLSPEDRLEAMLLLVQMKTTGGRVLAALSVIGD